MSVWRRKALEFIPQLRCEIESADSVTYLWVQISEEFRKKVDEGNQEFIDGVLNYLTWSFSDAAGMESQQAVNCGFLEDITYNKSHWHYFSDWFTPQQFRQYKESFKYALSAKEYSDLESLFFGKSGQFRV